VVGAEQRTAAQLPPVSQAALDQDLAQRSVVRRSDLPAGWREQADDEAAGAAADEDADDAELMACLGFERGDDGSDLPTADSPDFTDGDAGRVGSTAFVFEDESTAQVAFPLLTDERAQGCYRDLLGRQLAAELTGQGVEIGDVTAEPATMATAADETNAMRITVPLTIAGRPFTMQIDFVFVREGRVMGLFSFFDFPTTFPADVEAQVLEGPVSRMASS
jgi:hypothetical protein